MKHKIENGSLVWENLSIGNLITGQKLSWYELRAIVITSTRFASGRPIETRTLDELKKDAEEFTTAFQKHESQQDNEINNLKVQLDAAQETINEQNSEINTLRKGYEVSRAIQE